MTVIDHPQAHVFMPDCYDCARDGQHCDRHARPVCPDCSGSGVIDHRQGETTCPVCVSNDPVEFMPADYDWPF